MSHLQTEDDANEEGDGSEDGQQRTWDQLPASAWPLVATFREVLDLLSAGLPEPFLFGRRLTPAATDDGDELGELADADADDVVVLAQPDVRITSATMAAKEVDMDAFLRQYWPHFNQARCWSGYTHALVSTCMSGALAIAFPRHSHATPPPK